MRSIRWTALVILVALLAAPAAGAASREGGAGEPPAPLARLADWLGGVWWVIFGAGSTDGDCGPDIDPNGLVGPPQSAGCPGEGEAGMDGQSTGDRGPDIDPDG